MHSKYRAGVWCESGRRTIGGDRGRTGWAQCSAIRRALVAAHWSHPRARCGSVDRELRAWSVYGTPCATRAMHGAVMRDTIPPFSRNMCEFLRNGRDHSIIIHVCIWIPEECLPPVHENSLLCLNSCRMAYTIPWELTFAFECLRNGPDHSVRIHFCV